MRPKKGCPILHVWRKYFNCGDVKYFLNNNNIDHPAIHLLLFEPDSATVGPWPNAIWNLTSFRLSLGLQLIIFVSRWKWTQDMAWISYRLGFEIFLSNENNFESLGKQGWVLCRGRGDKIHQRNPSRAIWATFTLKREKNTLKHYKNTRWNGEEKHIETGKKESCPCLTLSKKTHWNKKKNTSKKESCQVLLQQHMYEYS